MKMIEQQVVDFAANALNLRVRINWLATSGFAMSTHTLIVFTSDSEALSADRPLLPKQL